MPELDSTATRPPRIGLALGCGGAKALVHMGVIKALEDHSIPIHAISGCSMGAYIGALWAAGKSADEMIKLAARYGDKATFKKMADPVIPPIRGLFYGNTFREELRQSIGSPDIANMDRKFIAVAANLDNYQRVIFDRGNILDAVQASCAMPGIIVPVDVNGIRCVDGGVVDPIPVGALRDYAEVDYIIAVSTTQSLEDIDAALPLVRTEVVSPVDQQLSWLQSKYKQLKKKYNPIQQGNMLDTLRRSLKASQIRMAHDACKRANLTIRPVTKDLDWHQFEQYEHFIEQGAIATLDLMDQIKCLTKPIKL